MAHETILLERQYFDECLRHHAVLQELLSLEHRTVIDTQRLLLEKTDYLSCSAKVLDRLVPYPVVSVGSPSLVMDYVPWVRIMVAKDDELEELSMSDKGEALRTAGRATRNNQGKCYPRHITLKREEREALDALAYRLENACESDGTGSGECSPVLRSNDY